MCSQQGLAIGFTLQLKTPLHDEFVVTGGEPGAHDAFVVDVGGNNIVVVGAANYHGRVKIAVILKVEAQCQGVSPAHLLAPIYVDGIVDVADTIDVLV